jgi:hypothetical protein
LADSVESAYNSRVGGEWGLGLPDLTRDSIIDAVGNHLVPMYQVIGPTAAVALVVLFLIGIAGMLADNVFRVIPIVRIRRCGRWLMEAFWGTLFQVAVARMQWAMAKGNTIGRTVIHQMDLKVACIGMQELETHRLNPDEPDQPSAPKGPLSNLDHLVN